MIDINKIIKDFDEQILEFFSKNPHKVYSPTIIANTLGINYNTVESALRRFASDDRIQQLSRGKYALEPLPKGQSTLYQMKMEEKR